MRMRIAAAVLSLVFAFGIACSAEMDVILDARPGTFIFISDTGDFEVLGPGPEPLRITEVEEAGEITAFPNIKLGLGRTTERSFLDFTGEVGMLINERFRALMLGADVAFQYRYRKNVAFGPHVSLLFFNDPDWRGDAKLALDDTSGILAGLQASIGYDVLFVFTIDYLFADPIDVTVEDPRWTPSDDEIDLEGFAVQFGIQGRI